jgi:uncharacterized protein (TIGR03000 family)
MCSKSLVLATVGLLAATETCQAQVGVWYGGRGGRVGVSVGQPYYGNYWGDGWGRGYYGGYYPAYGYGGFYSPYAYGYSMPYYYDANPTFWSNNSYQSFYPPDGSQGFRTSNTATIEVMVPGDAQLWFDDNKTQQTGPMRIFETPPLTEGKSGTYEIRATWTDPSGQSVTKTRTVQIAPNQHSKVNFLEADRQENRDGGRDSQQQKINKDIR